MKKMLTLIAAAFLALVPVMAANGDAEAVITETKTYQVDYFDALEVSWIYHVELNKSASNAVQVEAPDFLIPYLQVKVRKARLILSVSELPKDIRKKMEKGNYKVLATVDIQELNKVEMSGASRLVASGDFHPGSFRMDLSGATSVKGLNVWSNSADIQCSGASKFQMDGELKQAKLDLSGASKGVFEGDSHTLDIDVSGSGKLSLTGKYYEAKMDVSAAGHVNVKGSLDAVRIEGSGAAKLDLSECTTSEARIELSGASSASIYVLDKLGVSLSGASRCHYKAGEKLQIVETDVDRGASLKKL